MGAWAGALCRRRRALRPARGVHEVQATVCWGGRARSGACSRSAQRLLEGGLRAASTPPAGAWGQGLGGSGGLSQHKIGRCKAKEGMSAKEKACWCKSKNVEQQQELQHSAPSTSVEVGLGPPIPPSQRSLGRLFPSQPHHAPPRSTVSQSSPSHPSPITPHLGPLSASPALPIPAPSRPT